MIDREEVRKELEFLNETDSRESIRVLEAYIDGKIGSYASEEEIAKIIGGFGNLFVEDRKFEYFPVNPAVIVEKLVNKVPAQATVEEILFDMEDKFNLINFQFNKLNTELDKIAQAICSGGK